MMPGGHTPFGTRVFGNQGPVIDPGTLGPAIYLSGLPNDGVVAPGGLLTSWTDKVASYRFTPTVGSSSIAAFNDGSQGEPPGIWSVSMCGGSFYRGIDAQGTLPGFSNANGYTQYFLTGQIGSGAAAVIGPSWPSGTHGTKLIYQGATYNGGPPGDAIWTSGAGVGAAGHVVITDGSTGFDTGVTTPQGTQTLYDLWTLVSDGTANTTVYRNGVAVAVLATGTVGLATQLTFGGPSAGATFVCALISSYILYTAQHTPGQIAGVRRWFRQRYGV